MLSLRVDIAAIELRALVGVRKKIVSRRNFLEFLFNVLAPGVDVGMQFFGKLAISAFNFARARGLGNSKRLIGVDHERRHSKQEKANGKEKFPLRTDPPTAFLLPYAPELELDFQIPVAAWKRIPRLRSRLKKAAQATVDHLPRALRLSATATILLAGNAKVRQLNLDFRGIDKTTNVLSFPQFSQKEIKRREKQNAVIEIGDIALAYQYIAAEAKNENKPLLDHVTHLIIHGLLHLFGYDHGLRRNARRMEKTEIQIMKALGLPDPYAPLFSENEKRKT